jgi:hypothetical protein
MKKGIAITLALVMMVLFVGCGLANQLEGTKWEYVVYEETYEGSHFEEVLIYEFNKDDVFVMSVNMRVDGQVVPEYTESVKGTWAVDGDELTIRYSAEGESYIEIWTAEVDGDTLNLSTSSAGISVTIPFTRVK